MVSRPPHRLQRASGQLEQRPVVAICAFANLFIGDFTAMLLEKSIKFRGKKHLKVIGRRGLMPDLIIVSPTMIRDFPVKWVVIKTGYASWERADELEAQIEELVRAHGPGGVYVWRHGFSRDFLNWVPGLGVRFLDALKY